MIRLIPLLFALVLSFAQALTLEEALQAAPTRTAVATARIELRDAATNLERVQGDPLAVRSDTLQAEQRLALAKVSFTQAYYQALGEIETAYTNVLQARVGVQVSRKGVSVSEKSLEIAQIRVNNGSGTQLGLEEARTALNEAQNNLRSAQNNLNVALSNLEGILNQELQADALESVPDNYLVQVPELETVLDAAAEHPTVIQAEQQLALAQLNTEVLAPSYASQSQIDSAETGLTNARESVQETTRGFRIQARNLYNSASSAQETYQTQQEALQNANERLQTQQQRFEGGLISQIELSQAELSNLQAELSALQARYGYLTSLLELQSGTLVNLAGPDTLDAPPPSEIVQTQPMRPDDATNAQTTSQEGRDAGENTQTNTTADGADSAATSQENSRDQ